MILKYYQISYLNHRIRCWSYHIWNISEIRSDHFWWSNLLHMTEMACDRLKDSCRSLPSRFLLNMSQNKRSWLVGQRPIFCVPNFRALLIFGHTKQIQTASTLKVIALLFNKDIIASFPCFISRWKDEKVVHGPHIDRRCRASRSSNKECLQIFTDLWRLDDENSTNNPWFSMILKYFHGKIPFYWVFECVASKFFVTSLEVIRPNDEAVTWRSGSDDDVLCRKMIMSEQTVDPYLMMIIFLKITYWSHMNDDDDDDDDVVNSLWIHMWSSKPWMIFKIITMKIAMLWCFVKISIQTMDLNYVWFVRSHEWKKHQ